MRLPYGAEQPAAGDGCQRPLVPRSRCLPRLSRSVRLQASRQGQGKIPITAACIAWYWLILHSIVLAHSGYYMFGVNGKQMVGLKVA